MGQILTTPVTAKDSGDGAAPAKGLRWGYSCMQGWRVSMEDAHFALASLPGEGWQDVAAFAVMDGHGGKEVAQFCEEQLPSHICKGPRHDPRSALVDAFHAMDEMLGDETSPPWAASPRWSSTSSDQANPHWVGCTAVVTLVRPEAIIVANAGDSRAVLSRRRRALALSEDHKPNMPTELERIQRAGGTVERQQVGPNVQYRVCGNLNLSRSIGDLKYKRASHLPPEEQMICATPDVLCFGREAGDEFMIVACDGIWDCMTNQQAVDFVHKRLAYFVQNGLPLSGIMEDMLDACVSPDLAQTNGIGGDNMTALLVVFDSSPQAQGVCSVAAGEGQSPTGYILEPEIDTTAVGGDGFCGCRL